MADINWIKIRIDMFDDEKIKIIQSMPEGDAILVIWIRLIALAGKSNAGGCVLVTETIPYTDEMLSVIFSKSLTTVRLALNTFEQFHMIERTTQGIFLVNFRKHQNVEGLEKIREQNRLRKQREREKKALQNTPLPALPEPDSVTCHVTVTEESRDITQQSKNKRKNKDLKDINKKDIVGQGPTSCPNKEIIDYLNAKAGTSYRHTSKDTQKHISARFAEGYTLEDFKNVIDKKVGEWKTDPKMVAFIRPSTLFGTKFEGYLNQKSASARNGKTPGNNKFHNFEQRQTDYDALLQQMNREGKGEDHE